MKHRGSSCSQTPPPALWPGSQGAQSPQGPLAAAPGAALTFSPLGPGKPRSPLEPCRGESSIRGGGWPQSWLAPQKAGLVGGGIRLMEGMRLIERTRFTGPTYGSSQQHALQQCRLALQRHTGAQACPQWVPAPCGPLPAPALVPLAAPRGGGPPTSQPDSLPSRLWRREGRRWPGAQRREGAGEQGCTGMLLLVLAQERQGSSCCRGSSALTCPGAPASPGSPLGPAGPEGPGTPWHKQHSPQPQLQTTQAESPGVSRWDRMG